MSEKPKMRVSNKDRTEKKTQQGRVTKKKLVKRKGMWKKETENNQSVLLSTLEIYREDVKNALHLQLLQLMKSGAIR